MTSQEQNMNEMLGDPVKLTILGRVVEVKKLTIKKQFQVLDTLSGLTTAEKPSQSIGPMLDVISIATGIPVSDLEEGTSIEEVTAVFSEIWKQNGFGFLSQKARRLRDVLAGEASPSQA